MTINVDSLHCNVTSGAIKCAEFTYQLRDCQLLNTSEPRSYVLSILPTCYNSSVLNYVTSPVSPSVSFPFLSTLSLPLHKALVFVWYVRV